MKQEPVQSNGALEVNDLTGYIWLPDGISDLELEIDSINAGVIGEVMHPGIISSVNGLIYLKLQAPLRVNASSKKGEVRVVGMRKNANGIYLPRDEEPIANLVAHSKNGDVIIEYERKLVF